MMPRSRIVAGIVLAVVLVAGGVYYWSSRGGARDEGRGGGRGEQVVLVTLAKVEPRDFVDAIEAIGTAKANESIDITAKSTDTVGALNFSDGQKVEKGFVIAEMTSREQSADLGSARAALREAEKSYARIKELSAKGFATKAQMDGAVAAQETATARVRSLDSRVTDRLMRAPFAGVLGLRRVSEGSLVRPGDVITTLDDVSRIKLDFTVPEAYLAALKAGMPVRVKVAAYGERVFEGSVAGIDTRVDPVSRSIAVRAEIANAEGLLRPGMLMSVSLVTAQRTSLAVSEESLVPVEASQYVFVADGEMKAERRLVTIGAREPGFVEIKSGLKAGERVVVEGTIRLRPGATMTLELPKGDGPGGKGKRPEGARRPQT